MRAGASVHVSEHVKYKPSSNSGGTHDPPCIVSRVTLEENIEKGTSIVKVQGEDMCHAGRPGVRSCQGP